MTVQPAPAAPQVNRKSYRLPANINIEIAVPNIAVPVPATLADISEGGCQIQSRVMLSRTVPLQFKLPLDGRVPLQLSGTIRSTQSRADTRTFIYGVQFAKMRPAEQDAIYQFVVSRQRRVLHERTSAVAAVTPNESGKRRAAYRAKRMFPLRFIVTGVPVSGSAVALDVSRGGMRAAFDEPLREDRQVELRFTLPSDVLKILTLTKHRDFSELRIFAKILPGAERLKNKFVYRLVFRQPAPSFQEEIDRYVHAAQLTELKKTRNA